MSRTLQKKIRNLNLGSKPQQKSASGKKKRPLANRSLRRRTFRNTMPKGVSTSTVDKLRQDFRQQQEYASTHPRQTRAPRVLAKRSMIGEYLATLADPTGNMARIPDAYGAHSGLFRSTYAFNINITTNGSPDTGRFSFAAQPKIGGISNTLGRFKIALINSAQPWPVGQFGLLSSYSPILNGRDLRLDPYYPQMTQPTNFYFTVGCQLGEGDTITPAAPYGTVARYPAQLARVPYNYGLNPPYSVTPVVGGSGGSGFVLPAGEYSIQIYMSGTNLAGNPTNINFPLGTGVLAQVWLTDSTDDTQTSESYILTLFSDRKSVV